MTAAGAGGASTRSDSRRALAIFRRFAQGERRRFIGALFLMALEAVTVIALPSPKTGHIHEAIFRFIDASHIETEWTYYEDGKPGGTVVRKQVRLSR